MSIIDRVYVWKKPDDFPLCCKCGHSSALLTKLPYPERILRRRPGYREVLEENDLVLGFADCLLHGKEHRVLCMFPRKWLETGRAKYSRRELYEEFHKRYPNLWNAMYPMVLQFANEPRTRP